MKFSLSDTKPLSRWRDRIGLSICLINKNQTSYEVLYFFNFSCLYSNWML